MIKKIEKNSIKTIIFFGAIYFGLIFSIYYLIEKIENDKKEFLSIREEILSLREKESFLLDFKSTINRIFPDLIKIDNLFVLQKDPISFLNFLEKISSENNVKLEIKSSSIKEENEISYLIFTLDLTSSYPNFFKFLTKLEKGPYMVQITKVAISRIEEKSAEKEGAKEGDIKVNLNFQVPIK